MNLLDTAAILLTLAAVFGYINHRFFKLPNSIGILLIGGVGFPDDGGECAGDDSKTDEGVFSGGD